MTCLMLCRRAATDLDAEPAAAEPTFPPSECLSQVSAAERSPKKGCCFLLPPQKPGKQSLSGAAGFSHQYNIQFSGSQRRTVPGRAAHRSW